MSQGFHDVMSAFVLILEEVELAFRVAEAATLLFFTDFMGESFSLFSKSMRLILFILKARDPALYQHFMKIPHFEPFFATSWIVTWFSHHLDSIGACYA
jgi:TBC1 domain family member 20